MEFSYGEPGNAIMAEKGFTIESDIKKLNLDLNIPARDLHTVKCLSQTVPQQERWRENVFILNS